MLEQPGREVSSFHWKAKYSLTLEVFTLPKRGNRPPSANGHPLRLICLGEDRLVGLCPYVQIFRKLSLHRSSFVNRLVDSAT